MPCSHWCSHWWSSIYLGVDQKSRIYSAIYSCDSHLIYWQRGRRLELLFSHFPHGSLKSDKYAIGMGTVTIFIAYLFPLLWPPALVQLSCSPQGLGLVLCYRSIEPLLPLANDASLHCSLGKTFQMGISWFLLHSRGAPHQLPQNPLIFLIQVLS